MIQLIGESNMARTPKNTSIYDRLNKNEQDIINAENLLKTLKSEREDLLKEKEEFEMRKMWEFVKEQKLSLDEAKQRLKINIPEEHPMKKVLSSK